MALDVETKLQRVDLCPGMGRARAEGYNHLHQAWGRNCQISSTWISHPGSMTETKGEQKGEETKDQSPG